MTDSLRAGFIGLGAMGLPMAGHLARCGLLEAVWNRSPGRAAEAAGEGVAIADSPAALAARCNLVMICVSADADVLEMVDALLPGLAPGSIVVDHSTVSPATARTAAERLQAADCRFLDAPVSGGPEGAQAGTLSIMAGGEAADLDAVRGALECYGARISHMGPVGSGQAAKAVNQVLVAGIAAAVCEGLALGEALGLDSARLLPTLGAGAAANWFLEKRGASMLAGEFGTGFKLSLLLKDLRIVQPLARSAGTGRQVLEQALADYALLQARGHGEEDISALIRLKRQGGDKPNSS